MATVAVDRFASYSASPSGSFSGAVLITPDDTNELAVVTRGIMIGAAGALHVTFVDGSEVTLPSGFLSVGVEYHFRIKQVHAAGTTATPIYGLL